MSFEDCMNNAEQAGEASASRAQEARALHARLFDAYRVRIGDTAARAQATADTQRIMRAKIGRARKIKLLALERARVNTQIMDRFVTATGERNLARALPAFIEGAEWSEIQGVRPLAQSLRGFYHGEIVNVLSEFAPDLLRRTRNPARLRALLDELFGNSSGDPAAAELAQAVNRLRTRMIRDFNAAGGEVEMIENYGVPAKHDPRRLQQAGFEEWRDAIWNRLAWHRMHDFETDAPFAPEGSVPAKGGHAEDVLRTVFGSVTSNGWQGREPSFTAGGKSLANTRQEHRVLHFRGAEDWLAYNREFGREEDPYSAIVTQIDGFARDTAQMRVLGPNPRAGLQFLTDHAMIRASEEPWVARGWQASPQGEVQAMAHRSRAMLDLFSGAAQRPVDEHLGAFLAGVRSVLVSAQLGAAAISAVTDVGFQYSAARQIGMNPSRLIGRIGKELVGDRIGASRKGLIAESMANVGSAQARYMGEVYSPRVAERLADVTLRISGLSRWTEAGRHAFQLEFMGLLADNVHLDWDAMNAPLREVLERKGFTAAEWDMIRTADLHEEAGATFLVPHVMRYRTDIPEAQAESLAARLMSVIHEQTEFAVPSASLEGQAMLVDWTRPGTFIGELARSGMMYKSFGLSVIFNQWRRAAIQGGKFERFKYVASMGALLTVMGAISLQMKEITEGRDPRPIWSAKFLGAAVLQGGGLGIFGDFLAAEQNRFGGGIAGTLAGPGVAFASDLIQIGVAGARAAAGDRAARPGRKAANTLRYTTPVTGVWYWSQAFQRLMFDNIQRMVDPEAEQAWRDAERRRIRNYGNPAFWKPGDPAPSRSPDLGNALER